LARSSTNRRCSVDRCEYLLTIASVLCPRIAAISSVEAPLMAKCDAALWRRSWNRKSARRALCRAVSHGFVRSFGLIAASGVLGFFLPGKISGVSRRRTLRRVSRTSYTGETSGIERREPFLVWRSVNCRRWKSTSRHSKLRTSPRRMPVHNASSTAGRDPDWATPCRPRAAPHVRRSTGSGHVRGVPWACGCHAPDSLPPTPSRRSQR